MPSLPLRGEGTHLVFSQMEIPFLPPSRVSRDRSGFKKTGLRPQLTPLFLYARTPPLPPAFAAVK